jgi:hypothetical protein
MTSETGPRFEVEQEEGFALTYHSLSRHKTLSLEAGFLLIYLLSHDPEKYQIRMKTVIAHFRGRCGQKKLYGLVNELIEEGYILRTFLKHGNLKKEALYRVSGKPKFKKCLRNGSFGDHEGGDHQKCHIKEEQDSLDKSKELEEEQYKERSPVAPASAEAATISEYFFKKIKEHLPKAKPPNIKKWAEEMDRLLRIDKRTAQEVMEAIDWMQEDKWLKANVLSPKSLRSQFDRICAKMQMVKGELVVRKNRSFALQMKEQYPDKLRSLSFDDKYVMNRSAAKELPFNLPQETFQREFASLFGGRVVGGHRG